MPRRFLLTGGGTGGHVTPALAAAGALRERYPDADFRYVGLADKAEGVMAPKADLPLSRVTSRGFPPLGLGLVPFAWDLGRGVLSALFILLRHRPSLIIATGGYASAPVVLANALLRALRLSRCPLLVHEQNSYLGRMNRLAVRLADLVAVSFPETLASLPAGRSVYVGYPVRKSCAPGDRDAARQALGIPDDARVVFAFGGSQGARTINRAVVDAANTLLSEPDVWILHGCGRPFGPAGTGKRYDGLDDVERRLQQQAPDLADNTRYRRFGFIDDMAACYAASDLVICRGGAGSLMEVCAQQCAAVVIPKANLPGDHQVRNARLLERAGACRIVYERIAAGHSNGAVPYVAGDRLAKLVTRLLDDTARRRTMAAAAAGLATTDARDLLGACAASLLGDAPRPTSLATPAYPADRVMGLGSAAMERLLSQVQDGSESPLNEAEHELLLSKIDGLLASSDWVQRARGCRISGLAGYLAGAEILVELARRDVPMVRRDALRGLRGLGPDALDPAGLGTVLLQGLVDNYYEARAEAAETVTTVAAALSDSVREQVATRLATMVTDASFEVRMAACKALGRVADDPAEVQEALHRLHFDPVWKVRGMLFDAYAELADRGVMTADTARDELDQVLITANGYLTEYQIRHHRNQAVRRLPRRED